MTPPVLPPLDARWSPADVLAVLDYLDVSMATLARELGVDGKSVWRWTVEGNPGQTRAPSYEAKHKMELLVREKVRRMALRHATQLER